MKYICHAISLLAIASLSSQVSAQAKVEPAGMKIVWNDLKEEFDGFRTYNEEPGVYFNLAVRSGEKSFISFDDDKSKMTVRVGNDELKAKFGSFEKISKDSKTMRVEVKTYRLPKGGADNFDLKGNIDVVLASKSETKSSQTIALKEGDKVSLTDDFTFEIKKVGKPSWGDSPLEVVLEWKQATQELAAVRFFDKDGKEIESRESGSSSFGGFGKRTISKNYLLKKKVEQVKIEMDLWVDAEKVTIPVDLKLGLTGASQ